jgi:hypothetical protein
MRRARSRVATVRSSSCSAHRPSARRYREVRVREPARPAWHGAEVARRGATSTFSTLFAASAFHEAARVGSVKGVPELISDADWARPATQAHGRSAATRRRCAVVTVQENAREEASRCNLRSGARALGGERPPRAARSHPRRPSRACACARPRRPRRARRACPRTSGCPRSRSRRRARPKEAERLPLPERSDGDLSAVCLVRGVG